MDLLFIAVIVQGVTHPSSSEATGDSCDPKRDK